MTADELHLLVEGLLEGVTMSSIRTGTDLPGDLDDDQFAILVRWLAGETIQEQPVRSSRPAPKISQEEIDRKLELLDEIDGLDEVVEPKATIGEGEFAGITLL